MLTSDYHLRCARCIDLISRQIAWEHDCHIWIVVSSFGHRSGTLVLMIWAHLRFGALATARAPSHRQFEHAYHFGAYYGRGTWVSFQIGTQDQTERHAGWCQILHTTAERCGSPSQSGKAHVLDSHRHTNNDLSDTHTWETDWERHTYDDQSATHQRKSTRWKGYICDEVIAVFQKERLRKKHMQRTRSCVSEKHDDRYIQSSRSSSKLIIPWIEADEEENQLLLPLECTKAWHVLIYRTFLEKNFNPSLECT